MCTIWFIVFKKCKKCFWRAAFSDILLLCPFVTEKTVILFLQSLFNHLLKRMIIRTFKNIIHCMFSNKGSIWLYGIFYTIGGAQSWLFFCQSASDLASPWWMDVKERQKQIMDNFTKTPKKGREEKKWSYRFGQFIPILFIE